MTVDNKWVVPYNRTLLLKYGAHMNVEVCSTVKAIKYIHKRTEPHACSPLPYASTAGALPVHPSLVPASRRKTPLLRCTSAKRGATSTARQCLRCAGSGSTRMQVENVCPSAPVRPQRAASGSCRVKAIKLSAATPHHTRLGCQQRHSADQRAQRDVMRKVGPRDDSRHRNQGRCRKGGRGDPRHGGTREVQWPREG